MKKIPDLCHKPEFSFVIIYVGALNLLSLEKQIFEEVVYALYVFCNVFKYGSYGICPGKFLYPTKIYLYNGL